MRPSTGRVLIAGRDVTALAAAERPTTTVFQDYALFPHRRRGQCRLWIAHAWSAPNARRKRANDMLDLVGLGGYGIRRVHQLSGGQQQRVALARAVAVEPAVLLLDEPLGALDLHLRRQMQEELKAIQRRLGATFVHVTHDQEEAMTMADRIILMNQGRIEDSGPPERIYRRPATAFSARFMGESNVFEGIVLEGGLGTIHVETSFARLTIPGSGREGDRIQFSVRPEQVLVGPTGDEVERFRDRHRHRAKSFAEPTIASAGPSRVTISSCICPPNTEIAPGDRVVVGAKVEDIVLLA